MLLEQPTPTEHRWLMGLTFSLVACFIAVAWINREPLCIESEIFRRVEYRADGASTDVFRCRARRHIGYHAEIAQQLPELNARLQRLEYEGPYFLGSDWKVPSFRLRVVNELAKEPEDGVIEVTPKELTTAHVIESRVMDRVLRQNLKHANGPSAELLSAYFQDLTGHRPVLREAPELEARDWKIALYAEAVRRARGLLPLGEQRMALDEWRALLNRPEASAWSLPERVQNLMHESLAAFGYRQDLRAFQIPFAVMWPDRKVDLSETQMNRIQRMVAAVVQPDRIYFPFSRTPFSRVNAAPVQVGRLVLFQCGLPRLDELEKLGVEFEHLLFVQNCDEPDADLIVSALRNPRYFVKDYPAVDFAQIHWPSLRLALEKSGVRETSLTGLFREDRLASFRKIGFLSSIDQDPVTGIQSWKGALEPVPMFRLKGGTN
ncbi:MAG: hypothetical protein KF767_01340 [Bdellovibrionaceae bacterium]|nr:hypothetical protein [Pseudobdellovibrionaceae bacterium]